MIVDVGVPDCLPHREMNYRVLGAIDEAKDVTISRGNKDSKQARN
jgi:hypothetical protein